MNQPIGSTHLALLGGAELRQRGAAILLPLCAHRLLGFLALQDQALHRPAVAEALWPGQREGRAAANLRSALWHTRRIGLPTIVASDAQRVRLAPEVLVDMRDVTRRAREIITTPISTGRLTEYADLAETLSRELLPDWSDNWVLIERERWDQVRLHALEALARGLLAAEQYLPALEVAFTAVAIEPVRESAHRTVIEIHLAEGNPACAIKHYQRYRGLMMRELGVAPSPHMQHLIHNLGTL